MNYPGIRIEGAILSPDMLDRLDDVHGQRPVDFGFSSSVRVKDEIARAWADAQDYWRIFNRKLESLKPDSPATTETRNNWIVPLLGLLGYQLEYQSRSVELNGKGYPISHRAINRGETSVHIVGYGEPAQLDRKPERATLRMSAHAMLQEYLNLTDQVYGIVTNGRVLRLLRDSSRLVKLTYLEFDLDRIFTDGLFADFAILFRLLHASRLPSSHESTAESIIERYHQDSLDFGERIRDGLSIAVKQAILDFANGFLAHPDNVALRDAIATGGLKPDAYYQNLLRLIYRILFLLVIEERDLVYPLSPSASKRELYYRYYSLQRLRRLSEKRHLADRRRGDLWLALLANLRLFEEGGPGNKLGLAPLAGDLFGTDAIGHLNCCVLGNDVLLGCLRSLGLYENPESRQTIRVNYGALNVEEFGSVYEGLLEYEPVFLSDGRHVTFAFTGGDRRSATGSHYTPDDLVQPLLKHSLDPIISMKLKEPDPEKALLSLRVADIACGSGHILLAAARRIATELAVVRTREEQPSPPAFRSAIRDVIRECIYGVDLNPLAVELCKVALWLEAHCPNEPLNFLDHHIKCGNAIVGYARREEMERGVPEEAFVTMPGDEKEVAASLRKRNKAERTAGEQLSLNLSPEIRGRFDTARARWREIAILPERTPGEIACKKRLYFEFIQSPDAVFLKQLADTPVAQFYLPKTEGNQGAIITDGPYRRLLAGIHSPPADALQSARDAAARKRFFHWFLEFPEIMNEGGFDCILGNPPYLGGKAISGTYGHSFGNYVRWEFAPAGLSDLVVYFVRRIFGLLRQGGSAGVITTNSIKDGDIRKDGLEQVLAQGGTINFAVRGIKWPGRANLVVSLVGFHKGLWKGSCSLDGREVEVISAYFEDDLDVTSPIPISDNAASIYQGSVVLGDGFLILPERAKSLIQIDPKSAEVIFPIINGAELNGRPDQSPDRWVINFFDWPIEKAQLYAGPLAHVEATVYHERIALKDNERYKGAKNKWWRYIWPRPELYAKIRHLDRCFVAAATTKYLNFSASATERVFTHALFVFTTDRWDLYAMVQSTIHEVWARKYSGALKQDLRYSPSNCFETFAFPDELWNNQNPVLAKVGERYHEYRRTLMRRLWLGLTDVYNLFHARDLSPAMVAKDSEKPDEAESGYQGLVELRRLHRELDLAVLSAYGWNDIDLGHDFHEVETLPESDRARYTISPGARKELLRRLLALNHQRAAEQVAAPVAKKGSKKIKSALPQGGLFPQPEPSFLDNLINLPDLEWQRIGTSPDADAGLMLAAILKAVDGSMPIRDYRLAFLLAMVPSLLTPGLPTRERRQWQRLVGPEAKPVAVSGQLLPAAAGYWGPAVRAMRARGRLVEDPATGKWGPGEGLENLLTDGWRDGRARMVIEVVRRRNLAEDVVRLLPPVDQRWLDEAAG
jgi:hypothetical protein